MPSLSSCLEEQFGAARMAPEAGPLGTPVFWPTASGIEVACLDVERARRRELIDSLKAQRRGRATPLLLLVQRDSALLAIGPEGLEPEPVEVLPQLLERLDPLLEKGDRETAVHQLQALLADLSAHPDRTPGVRPAGLFTPHFLFERLPQTRFWDVLQQETPEDAPEDWRALLERLGYELETLSEGFIAKANGDAIAVVRAEETARAAAHTSEDDLLFSRARGRVRERRSFTNGSIPTARAYEEQVVLNGNPGSGDFAGP